MIFATGGIALIFIVIVATPVTPRDLIPSEYADQFDNPQEWGQSNIDDALIPRMFSGFLAYIGKHLREAIISIGGGSREVEFGKR